MKPVTARQLVLWNAVAIAAGLVPLALYWGLFSRVPSVSVAEAKALLIETNSASVLVDVRPAEAYASDHVVGAINWPYETIRRLAKADDIPATLRDQKLLLLCETGLSSALAVRQLRSWGGVPALNIAGGLQAWLAYGDGRKSDLPLRPMSRFEQWLAVIVAFGIKPVYMLLSFILILWLWRQRAVDLAFLRWGLIWFWLGENACSIDYLFFARGSDFWEYLHGYGMAVGFSMIIYAFLEGFDYRVIKFSPEKERCAALSLCHACMKHAEAPCGLKRLFMVMIPALMLLALMPLCASFNLTSYDTDILGSVHNYRHLMSSQLFELRFCAVAALGLFGASWLALMFKRREPVAASKVWFAAAFGPLSFGVLRMFFVATFTDNLMWFDVWEEITELLFVIAAAVVLWVFREALFTRKPLESATPRSAASGA